jgi:2'-5' RNA ligase
MPYAVTLHLNSSAAERIRSLWRLLSEAGVDNASVLLNYPPHVTLAIYSDNFATNRGCEILSVLAEGMPAIPITLAALGVFPGSAEALCILPVVTAELLSLRDRVHHHLADCGILQEFYTKRKWVPHITLAKGMQHRLTKAVELVTPIWQSSDGYLDKLELVYFLPPKIFFTKYLTEWEPTNESNA